ncbi:hypothetical protein O3P69_010180 [Scylla paramamosain]|uniref:Uncharacterized protein n=1 Tax=Scylla paramamosain TaxID=85552 RepID=A0AAW0TRB0_SCYPA
MYTAPRPGYLWTSSPRGEAFIVSPPRTRPGSSVTSLGSDSFTRHQFAVYRSKHAINCCVASPSSSKLRPQWPLAAPAQRVLRGHSPEGRPASEGRLDTTPLIATFRECHVFLISSYPSSFCDVCVPPPVRVSAQHHSPSLSCPPLPNTWRVARGGRGVAAVVMWEVNRCLARERRGTGMEVGNFYDRYEKLWRVCVCVRPRRRERAGYQEVMIWWRF